MHPIKSHVHCSGPLFCCSIHDVVFYCVVCWHCFLLLWVDHFCQGVTYECCLFEFSNDPTNSDSVADSITFLIILHSTCTGPFSWFIAIIDMLLLDFWPSKNIHLFCSMPLVVRCGMHMNICVESSRFLCILSLCLDMMHCNSINEWFYSSRFWTSILGHGPRSWTIQSLFWYHYRCTYL